MKILVLCYEYPPIGGGGGRVAAQMARELARLGHEVRVQTSGMRHLPARENDGPVEVIRTESFRRREDTCTVPEMALYLLTSFFPAWSLARSWRPDVIHVHFAMPTGVLACLISRLTGIPYVLTAHLGDVPGGVPEQTAHLFRLIDPAARIVWRSAVRVTAVSTFVGNLAQKAYSLTPVVIRNGVEARGLSAPPPHPGPPRLLFVGRLSVQKNPLLAVRALALLKDIPWRFEVIGEGPLGADMREEVRRCGLEDRLSFHGWLPGKTVAARMEASDILLMTSLHEGLPMVGVEALQHGLAIVGSDIGGMRDIVEENGFLCPLDPEAYASRLRLLLTQPETLLTFRQASLALAVKFDLPRIVGQYEQVLLEAAGKPA